MKKTIYNNECYCQGSDEVYIKKSVADKLAEALQVNMAVYESLVLKEGYQITKQALKEYKGEK